MAENDLGMGNFGITQGEGAAQLYGGYTGKTIAEGFVNLRFSGLKELSEKLIKLAARVGDPQMVNRIVEDASKIIERGYKQRVGDVTGNLKKSTTTRTKYYKESGVTIAITGPKQTGPIGSTEDQASGNHAWLVEFGTKKRRPGTQGRRTYINVHQSINMRMRRHSSVNDEQFARMSRGYYFLMGSKDEPTRQARAGRGYPHDFGYTDGRQHPVTLHPGEVYGAMPARHAMQRTINEEERAVFNHMKTAIENTLRRYG